MGDGGWAGGKRVWVRTVAALLFRVEVDDNICESQGQAKERTSGERSARGRGCWLRRREERRGREGVVVVWNDGG